MGQQKRSWDSQAVGRAVILCLSLQMTLLRREAWSGLTEVTLTATSRRSAYVLLLKRHGLYYEIVTDVESGLKSHRPTNPSYFTHAFISGTCLTLVRSRECIIKIESLVHRCEHERHTRNQNQ